MNSTFENKIWSAEQSKHHQNGWKSKICGGNKDYLEQASFAWCRASRASLILQLWTQPARTAQDHGSCSAQNSQHLVRARDWWESIFQFWRSPCSGRIWTCLSAWAEAHRCRSFWIFLQTDLTRFCWVRWSCCTCFWELRQLHSRRTFQLVCVSSALDRQHQPKYLSDNRVKSLPLRISMKIGWSSCQD